MIWVAEITSKYSEKISPEIKFKHIGGPEKVRNLTVDTQIAVNINSQRKLTSGTKEHTREQELQQEHDRYTATPKILHTRSYKWKLYGQP